MKIAGFNINNISTAASNHFENSPSFNLLGRSVSVPYLVVGILTAIVIVLAVKFFVKFMQKPTYINPWADRLRLNPNNQNFPSLKPLLDRAFKAEKKNSYNNDFIAQPILLQPNPQQVAEIKAYVSDKLATVRSKVTYFLAPPLPANVTSGILIDANRLNPDVFSWTVTRGVQHDIQQAGKIDDGTVELFGGASQFNGAESPGRDLVRPLRACKVYQNDRTQGPTAQLQFHPVQVEAINIAANLGYSGLQNVLDVDAARCVRNGYFTPTKESYAQIREQLINNADQIEYLSVEGFPYKDNKFGAKPVHLCLVAAPAFGFYSNKDTVTGNQQLEIQFLCALQAFRAQFQRCLDLAEETGKPVIFKPAAMGLGVFGNKALSIARAFYAAADEYQERLADTDVKVVFQVYQGGGLARQCVDLLGLQQSFPPAPEIPVEQQPE